VTDTETQGAGRRLERFADLEGVDDEVLRQVGARVHIVDLAYAFGTADPAFFERLCRIVRPGLANDIRSSVQMMRSDSQRYPLEFEIRTAQARVLEIARGILEDDSKSRTKE
jgi:hypothetical protein